MELTRYSVLSFSSLLSGRICGSKESISESRCCRLAAGWPTSGRRWREAARVAKAKP